MEAKPTALVMCRYADGTVREFPIETENYVLSALPYGNGLYYMIYEDRSKDADWKYVVTEWALMYTDGKTTEELIRDVLYGQSRS